MQVMSGFPRAVFSNPELDSVRWCTSKCGVPGFPKSSELAKHRETLIEVCGAGTRIVDGKLGNTFAVNDLATILKHVRAKARISSSYLISQLYQEMSNPLVRSHLKFYAEDAGKKVSEARHGTRWSSEVSASLAGPMARLEMDGAHLDLYVHEAAIANIDELGTLGPVMPTRWFERDGKIVAKAHSLRLNETHTAFIIDSGTCFDIPVTSFIASFVELSVTHRFYGLPSPRAIDGTRVLSAQVQNLPILHCRNPRL